MHLPASSPGRPWMGVVFACLLVITAAAHVSGPHDLYQCSCGLLHVAGGLDLPTEVRPPLLPAAERALLPAEPPVCAARAAADSSRPLRAPPAPRPQDLLPPA